MQPDTIIPDLSNPQGWNRYSYVLNNPSRYSDPTGHKACGDEEDIDCNGKLKKVIDTKANCSGSECRGGKNDDEPCSKSDNVIECAGKRIKSGADYTTLNGFIALPVCAELCGFDVSVTKDHYGNWYFGGGIGLTFIGFGASWTKGWFLSDSRNERDVEQALLSHSWTVTGGAILGGGVFNGDPSFVHPEGNYQTEAKNVALEGGFTTPGLTAAYTYGVFIYDNGSSRPWIWQKIYDYFTK